jgi:adenylate cyclase
MPHEIERKFIVEKFPPEVLDSPVHTIRQGYISDDRDVTEVRLRKKDDRHYLTIKKGSDLVRNEGEIELTREQFDSLRPMTEDRCIVKKRYLVNHKSTPERIIEVDVYEDELEGLIIAEVEFPSVEDSKAFNPPDWFGREVTNSAQYKNRNLALSMHCLEGNVMDGKDKKTEEK